MKNIQHLNKQNTFNNPFDDINANTLDSERILDLWCTPFVSGILGKTTERDFATSKTPLILEGSRGTGKTTILKYFSYPLQKARANHEQEGSILRQIEAEKSSGFYFRCDDSFVNTFKSIFKAQHEGKWIKIFEHYLELQFSKHLINVILDCIAEKKYDIETPILDFMKKESNVEEIYNYESLQELLKFIENEARYMDRFKNEILFTNSEFNPTRLFDLYELSEKLIFSFLHHVPEVKNTLFLILIDEFESLTSELQRLFNTIIKYSKQSISFRIGRRSEGLVETSTISAEEYLRVNNDYLLVKINGNIEERQQTLEQKKYFEAIGQKRLMLSKIFDERDSIQKILGERENLDEESFLLCNMRTTHLELLLAERPELKENIQLKKTVVDIIKYPENPIAETLNAIWVIRSKTDPLDAAKVARETMNAFLSGKDGEFTKKYNNDYTNKYRYAITVLLASLYKKQKLYYSFNTIAYLSDGNTRTFINLCRSIFNDALFYEKNDFINSKTISKESQSRAIHEFATLEFNGICSIISYGEQIRNFVINIGNILASYHKDKKVKYPETVQFSFNKAELPEHLLKIINIAENWSMIIKKEKTQRLSLGHSEKGILYRLNRVFCPIFSISYRTRGGFNPSFTAETLQKLTTQEYFPDERTSPPKKQKQFTLFDYEDK